MKKNILKELVFKNYHVYIYQRIGIILKHNFNNKNNNENLH